MTTRRLRSFWIILLTAVMTVLLVTVPLVTGFLVTGVLVAGPLEADEELARLAKEYSAAKTRLGGNTDERPKKVKEFVLPVARQIAALGTDEAIAFLAGELNDPVPHVVAAASVLLVESEHPKALRLVLHRFGRRPPLARAQTWEAMAQLEKKQLRAVEKELLAHARDVEDPAVKRHLPAVLGKLGSLAAAKFLLRHVKQVSLDSASSDAERAYSAAVVQALSDKSSAAVKKWLAKGAFKAARKNVGKLLVVTRIAQERRSKNARTLLVRNISHRAPDVAAASLDALVEIGLRERDVKKIAAFIKKRKGPRYAKLRIRALLVLAATNHESALAVIRESVADRDADTRAVAMECLGGMAQKEEALPLLIEGLKDEAQNVRVNALRALGRMRDKAIIGPLIEMLGEEQQQRLRLESLRYLVGLTGNNMGLEIVDWRKWWDTAERTFRSDDKKVAKTQVATASVHDLSYFGIEVSSERVTFVVDVSGSMRELISVDADEYGGSESESRETAAGNGEASKALAEADETEEDGDQENGAGEDDADGEESEEKEEEAEKNLVKRRRIDVLKTELLMVIEKLAEETQINIVLFDAKVRAWQKHLQPLAAGGRAKAVEFVKTMQPGSGTNVYDSLEWALNDKRVDTIYLLTDGAPTRGKVRDPDEIVKEIRILNLARGLTIHCISIGEEVEDSRGFLKRLAEEHGGEYRTIGKVPDEEDEK